LGKILKMLKFNTRKSAEKYSRFIRNNAKSFGMVCKPKIVERVKDNHFVVIERCKKRKR